MDCPESNQLLDKVRFRLEEAARQVNLAAVNGPRIRDRMEKTWLLQERLSFKDKVSPVGGEAGVAYLGIVMLTCLARLPRSPSWPDCPVWCATCGMARTNDSSRRVYGLPTL